MASIVFLSGLLNFSASLAVADCANSAQGVTVRCPKLEALATPEEAQRLTAYVASLTTPEILKKCQPAAGMMVTEYSGLSCGPGALGVRMCVYSGALNCVVDGKLFEIKTAGNCQGGPHDCGTFAKCAGSEDVKKSDGAFRAESAAVPKSFDAGSIKR